MPYSIPTVTHYKNFKYLQYTYSMPYSMPTVCPTVTRFKKIPKCLQYTYSMPYSIHTVTHYKISNTYSIPTVCPTVCRENPPQNTPLLQYFINFIKFILRLSKVNVRLSNLLVKLPVEKNGFPVHILTLLKS